MGGMSDNNKSSKSLWATGEEVLDYETVEPTLEIGITDQELHEFPPDGIDDLPGSAHIFEGACFTIETAAKLTENDINSAADVPNGCCEILKELMNGKKSGCHHLPSSLPIRVMVKGKIVKVCKLHLRLLLKHQICFCGIVSVDPNQRGWIKCQNQGEKHRYHGRCHRTCPHCDILAKQPEVPNGHEETAQSSEIKTVSSRSKTGIPGSP